jgi:type VI secretion system protein ImpJ
MTFQVVRGLKMYSELQQVYWYSGVYLQPQHMQSLDLHHAFMLSRHRQQAQPWNFGLIECKFNSDVLIDYTLKIDALKAQLPSGDYLEFPGNCFIASRKFRDVWKQADKPFTLWLALRRLNPGHSNVGVNNNSRWLNPPEDREMKDLYFNGPSCSVSRILYNVQILTDEEVKSAVECEALPLIKLRQEDGRVVLDNYYSPPLVSINGFPTLKSLLDGIYAELANRAHQLAEYKRPGNTGPAQGTALTQLLIMQIINRTLPLLKHYCETSGLHPWSIYGLLAQLTGELSSFSQSCSFRGSWEGGDPLLPYNHFQLYQCFSDARQRITALLNNVLLENNTWIILMPDEQRIFHTQMPILQTNNAQQVLLMLRSDALTVTADFDCSNLKLSSCSSISSLIQHALPGIPLTPLNIAPDGVPHRQDTFYFHLNMADVPRDGNESLPLAFYWVDAPDDLQVQLVLIGEKNGIT